MLLRYANSGGYKIKPIGNEDDRQFTIIVNSASTAAPIGLPTKMAKFCHTPNRLLMGRQCRRALLWLYFNSSATGRSAVGGWQSVRNKGCQALGGSLQKDKMPLLQSNTLLASSWLCLRCSYLNDSTKNKKRCSSCQAWRDGLAPLSAKSGTLGAAASKRARQQQRNLPRQEWPAEQRVPLQGRESDKEQGRD